MLRDSTTPTTTTTTPPTLTKSPKPWWNPFSRAAPKPVVSHPPYREDDNLDHPVFGKTLQESLAYASVQISTADAKGDLYVWGSIPVVVAKCGLYLKEHATEIPGTFRVNGSNKRMRDLQAAFETPPRYGKSLDWRQESYTTHDVASVFRRYLTHMPEPVIPHDMYHLFRDALAQEPFNQERVIATYKSLIRRLPVANQYLLLYVLDLLSVFARKSDKNLMTAANLAVIFRPGLISHPQHEMSPQEHALSQRVLEFLIAQQDWFMLDIAPPPLAESGPSTSNGGGTPGHKDGDGWGSNGANGNKLRDGPPTPTRQNTWAPGGAKGAPAAEAGPGPSSQMLRSLTNRRPQPSSPTAPPPSTPPTIVPNPPQPKRANTTPHTSPISPTSPAIPNHSKLQQKNHHNHSATTATSSPTGVTSPHQPQFAPYYSSLPSQTHPNPESHAHPVTHGRLAVNEGSSHTKPWTSSQLWASPPAAGHPNVPAIPKTGNGNRRPFSIGSGSTMVEEMMVIPSSDEEFARLSAATRGIGSGSGGASGSKTNGGSGGGWGGSGFLRSGKEKPKSREAEREREREEKKEKERAKAERERIKMMRRRTTVDPRSDLKLIPPILEVPSLSEGGLMSSIMPPAVYPDHHTPANPNPNDVHFDGPSNSPDDLHFSSKTEVKRSRTLPSSTRRRGSIKGSIMTVEDEYLLVGSHAGLGHKGGSPRDQEREKENLNYAKEREKRVLKKQRRSSGAAHGRDGPPNGHNVASGGP